MKTAYPKLRIGIEFSFFGGLIGGFLSGIVFAYTSSHDFFSKLFFIFICSLVGVFIGFIPASLTGWVLIKKKFFILENQITAKFFLSVAHLLQFTA